MFDVVCFQTARLTVTNPLQRRMPFGVAGIEKHLWLAALAAAQPHGTQQVIELGEIRR